MAKYTEQDLDLLIQEKLDAEKCRAYPEVCRLMNTQAGKQRIADRVKEIILVDGNTSVEGAIATVETELAFTTPND